MPKIWDKFVQTPVELLRVSVADCHSLSEFMKKYRLYAVQSPAVREFLKLGLYDTSHWYKGKTSSPKSLKSRQDSIRKAIEISASTRFERHRLVFEAEILPTLFQDNANGIRGQAARWLRSYNRYYGWLEEKCQLCPVELEWNGLPLSLQLDHKNGRPDDERLENLRYLCPNCHSQTETFGNRNKKWRAVRDSNPRPQN